MWYEFKKLVWKQKKDGLKNDFSKKGRGKMNNFLAVILFPFYVIYVIIKPTLYAISLDKTINEVYKKTFEEEHFDKGHKLNQQWEERCARVEKNTHDRVVKYMKNSDKS